MATFFTAVAAVQALAVWQALAVGPEYNRYASRALDMLGALANEPPKQFSFADLCKLAAIQGQATELGLRDFATLCRVTKGPLAKIVGAWTVGDWDSVCAEIDVQIERLKAVVELEENVKKIRTRSGLQLNNRRRARCLFKTARAKLYRIRPLKPGVRTLRNCKPIIMIVPTILSADIANLLVEMGIGSLQSYADLGIPTYIVILDSCDTSHEVRTMTIEDYTEDVSYFARCIMELHGHKVTLAGICQGGYFALAMLLTKRFEGIVDALSTDVTPYDGSKCTSLASGLQALPDAVRNDLHAASHHVGGDIDISGGITKSNMLGAEQCTMWSDFFASLEMASKHPSDKALAIRAWLEKCDDMPYGLTEWMLPVFLNPIGADGTLPVKIFGQTLNVNTLVELGTRVHVNAATEDRTVPLPAALALANALPEGVVDVALTPGGHIKPFVTAWKDGEISPDVDFHLKLEAA